MQIEIIGIGDEILTGQTVNTNAAHIGRELERAGLSVGRHIVLPDNANLLKQGMSEALQRSQIVITTGGLGPTLDDNTRRVAAELFDSDFVFNEEIAADLKRRYADFPISLQDQATVPRKAKVLHNDVGTAPGFIFSGENRTLILLPGPPFEMKKMLDEQVLPFLLRMFAKEAKEHRKFIHLFNMGESSVDPLLRELRAKYPSVEIGIYASYGLINIQLKHLSQDEKESLEILNKPYQEILAKFSRNVFEADSGKIEEAVHNRMIAKGLTLCAAESCTGGALSARLTRLPGASKYFSGSVVVYANELKVKALGVPEALILEKGAVSSEVVEKMVEGILRLSGADFAVADTGIAGPSGGTPEKPVGTVWCAIGKRNNPVHVWKIHRFGTREMIIERTVNALLAEVLVRT